MELALFSVGRTAGQTQLTRKACVHHIMVNIRECYDFTGVFALKEMLFLHTVCIK